MKRENINYLKSKYDIDIDKYPPQEQEKIITYLECILSIELINEKNNNIKKREYLNILLEKIKDI